MSAYQIYQFDDVDLPSYNQEQDLGTGAVESAIVESVGGSFDVWPDIQRTPRLVNIAVAGIYASLKGTTMLVDHDGNQIVDHSGNRIIATTDPQLLRAQLDAIRAKRGLSAKLWRRRWDDQSVHQWKTARLLDVQERNALEHRTHLARVDLQFESTMGAWRDASADTITASVAANGVAGLLLESDGNATIEDTIITVTASGNITSLAITIADLGVDLRYTGALASGQSLRIYCGTQTVTVGSAAAYAGFALGSGHTARTWLPLPPGQWLMLVTSDGPATITTTHYDQWV